MKNSLSIDSAIEIGSPTRRLTIGYLAGSINDSTGIRTWMGVIEAARKHDANLMCFLGDTLSDPTGSSSPANMIYRLVDPQTFDGLVSWAPRVVGNQDIAENVKFHERFLSIPLITIGHGPPDILSVVSDSYNGLREAMIHLIQVHGYRRIAFVRGPENSFGADSRYRAYCDTLTEYGIPIDPALITPPRPWSKATGGAAVQQLLFQHPRHPKTDLQAIVTSIDLVALGVLEELQACGIQVPGDIAVVGVDDSPEGRMTKPPLTSVKMPMAERGTQVMQMLLTQLAGKPIPQQVTLPTQLVVRQSCGCLDPLVAQVAIEHLNKQPETFKTAMTTHRAELLAAISSALQNVADEVGGNWAEHLLDSFVLSTQKPSSNAFLSELTDVINHTNPERDLTAWQGIISVLRRHTLPYLKGNLLERAETLWQQARVIIGTTAQQVEAAHRLQTEQQTLILREISHTLTSDFDFEKLMDVIARELPRLGIPSAYLSLYEDPQHPETWARLRLAYNEHGRIELEPGGQRFPSSHWVPQGMLPQSRQYAFVVAPLYFQENQIGILLLEVGPHDGTIYETLRAEISNALQGALLVQRVREHSAELARQNYILDAFMDTVPDFIYFKDRAGRFTRVNPAHAKRHGFSNPADVIGKSNFDLIPLPEAQHRHDEEQQIIQTGQLLAYEVKHVHPNGQVDWVATTKMPLRDEHGQIIGIIGISRDITELKQAQALLLKSYEEVERQVAERTARLQEEIAERQHAEAEREALIFELEAKNSELERFVYTVSHDLKSPLVTIRGFLGFLEQDALTGKTECLRDDINRIVSATEKMQRLLSELLELSRIGRLMNPPELVAMHNLAQETVDLFRPTLATQHIQVDIQPDLPAVHGDRNRLLEVLQNLVDNAIKFIGEQPSPLITIGGYAPTPEAPYVFFVRDNGRGIDPRHQSKIFGLFEKLDPKTEGTGVGLAIVKRIVEIHGGHIWVESEGVGKGATFCFTLS